MEKVDLKQFPSKAKKGVVFLIVACAFLIFSQAAFFGAISLIQLTLGSFFCILVYSVKNWGRFACVIYNFLLIGNSFYTVFRYLQEGMLHPVPFGIHGINIVLFTAATYFLLHKETHRFFKSPANTSIPGTETGIMEHRT